MSECFRMFCQCWAIWMLQFQSVPIRLSFLINSNCYVFPCIPINQCFNLCFFQEISASPYKQEAGKWLERVIVTESVCCHSLSRLVAFWNEEYEVWWLSFRFCGATVYCRCWLISLLLTLIDVVQQTCVQDLLTVLLTTCTGIYKIFSVNLVIKEKTICILVRVFWATKIRMN